MGTKFFILTLSFLFLLLSLFLAFAMLRTTSYDTQSIGVMTSIILAFISGNLCRESLTTK